jgi:hypothetical protein
MGMAPVAHVLFVSARLRSNSHRTSADQKLCSIEQVHDLQPKEPTLGEPRPLRPLVSPTNNRHPTTFYIQACERKDAGGAGAAAKIIRCNYKLQYRLMVAGWFTRSSNLLNSRH